MNSFRRAEILICTVLAALVPHLILIPASSATEASSTALAAPSTQDPFFPGIHVQFHHYNICSARSGCPNDQGLNAQNLAAWFYVGEGAWSLSLNEACLSDMQYISNAVGQWFDGYIADTTVPACGAGIPWFGNAVVANGARRSGSPVQHKFIEQEGDNNCTPGTRECRGFVCILVDTYVGPYATCSAHMENLNELVAQAKANEYAWIIGLDARTRGIDRIASGDFNLTPSQVPGIWSGGSAYRSVNNQNSIPASSPSSKFDYIYTSSGAISNFISSRYCDASASDHCWMGTEVWN